MAKKQKTKVMLHDVVGWYGAIAIVSGYFLTSFDVIANDQLLYQLINLTGASGLFYLGYKKRVNESMFINAFWFIIASLALIKLVVD